MMCALVFCVCSLLNLCSVKNQDSVLKLAVSTLDYSRDGLARVILSKILTAATDVKNLGTQSNSYLRLSTRTTITLTSFSYFFNASH